MLTLIVNLDRAPERWERMQALMQKWGLPYERLAAVDGRQFSVEQLESLRLPYPERHYFLKDMTAGEIGCFLSHLHAWQRLLESNEEWALILEDDIEFAEDPRPYLNSLDWIPEGVKLIQLAKEFRAPKEVVREKTIHALPQGSRLLVLLKGIDGGCLGYLIHREVAAKAVAMYPPIPAPCDDLLFAHATPVRATYKPWALSPALIVSNEQGFAHSYVGRDKGKIKTSFWRGPKQYLERKLINIRHNRVTEQSGVTDLR